MTKQRHNRLVTVCLVFGSMCGAVATSSAQETGPHEWLDKMAHAVRTTNYEGTVIRLQNDKVEALKVVHMVSDGVVRERVIIQEGNGLEIIRNGNEVQCILPDKRSVLVEEWNDQSTVFSTLPSIDIRFGAEYDVSIIGNERIAGRKAVMLAIRPHDEYRFGHRLWLDTQTGFPLQTTLIGDGGTAVERVKFADISLGQEIHASALNPSVSLENFRWFTAPRREIVEAVDSSWQSNDLPPGFKVVSTHDEQLPGKDTPVTHILYSDGLASVSVFTEPASEQRFAKRSRVGASHSYSVRMGDYQVTAVGEVPATTVERIAKSMQYTGQTR
jgi:sigma-E factor negative regulatory protein RseB